MIKVGILAEITAMRLGLREVLNSLPDILVVFVTNSVDALPPDPLDVLVVVPNSRLGKVENQQAVLFLAEHQSEIQGLFQQDLSTWGVLQVNASQEELSVAIHALAEGLWIGSPGLIREYFRPIFSQVLEDKDYSIQTLTPREGEVLQLAAQGYPNKQIAGILGISEHTIKFHLSSLYSKLRVSNRTEALRVGVIKGLIVM